MKLFFLFLSIFIFQSGFASSYVIGPNLTRDQQRQYLKIIGLGSAPRLLTDPSALGGYEGVELGLSYENINTESVSLSNNQGGQFKNISFSTLTFSKGLFYDVDIGGSFSLLPQSDEVSYYSGFVKWNFKSKFSSSNLSFWVLGNSLTLNNMFSSKTVGSLLVLSKSLSQSMSGIFGVGIVKCFGSFVGGSRGVTFNQENSQDELINLRYLIGLNYDQPDYFVSTELDLAYQVSLGFKIGRRF